MDYFCDQVQQKDVGRRMQIGQEFLEYLNEPNVSTDLEQDQQRLDKVIDEITGWVNSSNYKVRLNVHNSVLSRGKYIGCDPSSCCMFFSPPCFSWISVGNKFRMSKSKHSCGV